MCESSIDENAGATHSSTVHSFFMCHLLVAEPHFKSRNPSCCCSPDLDRTEDETGVLFKIGQYD